MPKRPTRPSDEELLKLKAQGISDAKLAHRYGRTTQTIRAWRLDATRKQTSRETGSDENLNGNEPAQEIHELQVPVLDDFHEENTAIAIQGSAAGSLDAVPDPPDLSACDRLTPRQLRAVVALTSMQPGDLKRTQKEICDEIGISEDMMTVWRRDPIFREALREIGDPEFASELALSWRRRIANMVINGTAKPEHDKLIAEMMGFIGPSGITVNLGVDRSDYLGTRFKKV